MTFVGLLLLSVAAHRLSAGWAWMGVALIAVGLAPGYVPYLLKLPTFAELVSISHATSKQNLSEVCKEAEQMVRKARTAPTKAPAIVSVERITERGVYDDVLLVYGYPDNYAAAREIAEYASQKYKRDYRFTVVQR